MVSIKMRKIRTYTQKLQSPYLTLKFYIQTYFTSASSFQESPFQSIFPEIPTFCFLVHSPVPTSMWTMVGQITASAFPLTASLSSQNTVLSLVCSLILHAMETSGCSYLAMYQSWWVSCQQPTSNSKLNTQLNTIKFYFSLLESPGKLY